MVSARHLRSAAALVVGVVAVLVGLWLLDDALTFALLADSSTGRTIGCYTALEMWFGRPGPPSDVVRSTELVSGLLLVAGSAVFLAVTLVRSSKWRR